MPGQRNVLFSEVWYQSDRSDRSVKSMKAGTARCPPTARPPPTYRQPRAHPAPTCPGDLICVQDPCALRPSEVGVKRQGANKNVPKGDSAYVVSWRHLLILTPPVYFSLFPPYTCVAYT